MANNARIKQVNTGTSTYDIEALYFGNRSASDWENMIQGVVDTYVIPTTKSSTSGYGNIVNATDSTITTSKAVLDVLVNNPPSGSGNDIYKVGDIILMEAASDGTKEVFDRWISSVNKDTGAITLAVLETQVAKHHHTYSKPAITSTSVKVITSVGVGSTVSQNMAYAGTDTSVVYGGDGVVITGITVGDGSSSLKVAAGASTDGSHTHTVNAHKHTVSYDKTTVSTIASAVTSLNTSTYTPHKHTVVSVAGKATTDTAITYAYGGGNSDTFIKTLKDSDNISSGPASPSTSEVSLTTDSQTTTNVGTITTSVLTTSSGSHTHTASTTIATNVVTAATVAASVVTSVSHSFTAPTVAASVVTSVSYTAKTVLKSASLTGCTTFISNVNVSDGVLSFSTGTVNISTSTETVASISSATRSSQSAGSFSISVSRTSQSCSSGKPTITTTVNDAGAHQHGFGHVHAIAKHKHTVDSHSHTYVKSIASDMSSALTSISTSSYTPHKHTDASVAVAGSASADTSSAITYVTGGEKTAVVASLSINSTSATVGDSSPSTTAAYLKITGSITHPSLTISSKAISTMLSTTNIKPAVDSGEKPIKTLTLTSVSVVKYITVTDSTVKTSTNVGGN